MALLDSSNKIITNSNKILKPIITIITGVHINIINIVDFVDIVDFINIINIVDHNHDIELEILLIL